MYFARENVFRKRREMLFNFQNTLSSTDIEIFQVKYSVIDFFSSLMFVSLKDQI